MELRALARSHTEEAVKTLVTIMRSTKAPAQARAFAAEKLLDRGYGKPLQPTEVSFNVFDQLSLDDKAALLAALDADAGGEGDTEGGPSTRH